MISEIETELFYFFVVYSISSCRIFHLFYLFQPLEVICHHLNCRNKTTLVLIKHFFSDAITWETQHKQLQHFLVGFLCCSCDKLIDVVCFANRIAYFISKGHTQIHLPFGQISQPEYRCGCVCVCVKSDPLKCESTVSRVESSFTQAATSAHIRISHFLYCPFAYDLLFHLKIQKI